MTDALTRRQLLLGGAVLLVSGCSQTGSESSSRAPTATSTFPPYDLGRAATPMPTGPSGPGIAYVVVAGDTLSGISRRCGVDLEVIVQSNSLLTAQLVRGQRLWLPGATHIGVDPVSRLHAPQEAAPDEDGLGVDDEHGAYVMVHREQWAVSPVRGNNLPMNGVNRITLHHTGEHAGLEGVAEVEVLRRIEHYHQVEKHWAAIGYHYLVGKTGRVYEGRPVHYQGAHVLANNEHNLGISVIGDFMNKLPNPRQLATVDAFLTDQRMRYRIPRTRIYGHRQLGTSLCPGDSLYSWLEHYRA
jgi:LysM repeat protein